MNVFRQMSAQHPLWVLSYDALAGSAISGCDNLLQVHFLFSGDAFDRSITPMRTLARQRRRLNDAPRNRDLNAI
jgi:hypothetical protein